MPISQAHSIYNRNNGTPLLKINPKLNHSWYDPPCKDLSSDTVSYWPTGTKFPHRNNSVPKQYPYKTTTRPKDLSIVDPKLKKLLEGNQLETITLDHSTFDPSTVSVKGSAHPKIDSFQRASLFEGFLSSELLDLTLALIPKIYEEIFTITQHEFEIPSLAVLEKLICQTTFSNERLIHSQSAGFVTNKLALRDFVLDKYTTPTSTYNLLRGSDFTSDHLFGPIPESFKDTLKTHQGKNLTATKKYRSSRYGNPSKFSGSLSKNAASKRMSSGPYPKSKRSKYSNPILSNPFFRSKARSNQKFKPRKNYLKRR